MVVWRYVPGIDGSSAKKVDILVVQRVALNFSPDLRWCSVRKRRRRLLPMTDDRHLARTIYEFLVAAGLVAVPAPKPLESRVCFDVVLTRETAGVGGRSHR
jgi:hypothetical protein